MKCRFWITLVPKYDGDEVASIKADKITTRRPQAGFGIAVPVSLDVSTDIFKPLHLTGEIYTKTRHVVLQTEEEE